MRNRKIIPVQPYVMINGKDYKSITGKEELVSYFYEFRVDNGNQFQAVPDGTTDLIFGIGSKDVKVFAGGTVLKLKKWNFLSDRTYFGVSFQPGKCILPDELTVPDLINEDVEVDCSSFSNQLTDRIAEEKDIYGRIPIFLSYCEEWKKRQKEQDLKESIGNYMLKRILATGGTITVNELARECGYSECYIRRIFSALYGISPKVFEKIVRFQSILNRISWNECLKGMEELAVDSGYYDQSHMMKDFKCFTGMTPENYKKIMKLGGMNYETIEN